MINILEWRPVQVTTGMLTGGWWRRMEKWDSLPNQAASGAWRVRMTGTEIFGIKVCDWGSSDRGLQRLLALGFQASFHRFIAKESSIHCRDKKPGRGGGGTLTPGLCPPDHFSASLGFFVASFRHFLFFPPHSSISHSFSLFFISHTRLLSPQPPTHTQPGRGKWKPGTVKCISQEQCAGGCFERLAKETGGSFYYLLLSLTSTMENKELPQQDHNNCLTGPLSSTASSLVAVSPATKHDGHSEALITKVFFLCKRNRCVETW